MASKVDPRYDLTRMKELLRVVLYSVDRNGYQCGEKNERLRSEKIMLQALKNATSWDVCGLAMMVLGPRGKASQQVEQGVFQFRL